MTNRKREYHQRVGKYLQAIRTEARITQNELAIHLGYDNSQFVSNMERGVAAIPEDKIFPIAVRCRIPTFRMVKNLSAAYLDYLLAVRRKQSDSSP